MHGSRERVARLVTIVGLYVCAAWAVWTLVDGAHDPHRYDGFRYRNAVGPIDWTYPTDEVVRYVIALILEAGIASVIVAKSKGHLGMVCLLLACVSGCATFATGILAMHAPLPYTTQVVFTLFATGWLVLSAIFGAMAASADKDRQVDCAPGGRA